MRCMICGKASHKDSIALHRVNDKGKPGVWACTAHYNDGRAYFPDDDPNAPPPPEKPKLVENDGELGPWTGGSHWP